MSESSLTNTASGEAHVLASGTTTLGRGDTNTIVLRSDKASRSHGMLELADEALTYTDLGSSNGSKINGVPITGSQAVFDGDILALADISFTVTCPFSGGVAKPSGDATVFGGDSTVIGGSGGVKVPAAWAESAGLERASATEFVAAGDHQDVTRPGLDPLQLDCPTLVEMTPQGIGRQFVLEPNAQGSEKVWNIGRNSDVDIVLSDNSVSGQHAQLINQGERWKVVNWLSTNGTIVNGKKTLSAYLSHGDAIRLGKVELIFALPNSAGETKKKGVFSRLFGK